VGVRYIPMNVAHYLSATQHVEGWFFPIDAHLFATTDATQKRMNVRGNLFEIGAHRGKSAIFLAHLASRQEILGVCDLFDQQELNVDHSGCGSRVLFEKNMRMHARTTNLRVFAKPSAQLTPEDTTTICRFFHIDGGHRPQDVYTDLETADRALLPHGVVAVDDVFNPSWPGVSEGVYRFLSERPKVFAPIAIGGNKVLFARPGMAQHYRIDALPPDAPFDLAEKEWLGYSVPTVLRRAWVDLDPLAAARLHFRPRTWRDRIRRCFL
jgi:Methyltransferase domain